MAPRPSKPPSQPERRGPAPIGTIVKRYRVRDKQYTFGLRIRAYGHRYWVPLGTEREGWNDVRAADKRDEIAALVRSGVWRTPADFKLDPRDKDPGFHQFASDWLDRYRRSASRPRTVESAEYLLRKHLLPYLREYRVSEIDYAVLAGYVDHKLMRNEEIEAARAGGVVLRDRHGRARRTLGPRTINASLDLLGQVLADACRRNLIPANPALDRELRLKVTRRRGNFLEADELLAVIDAAAGLDARISDATLRRAAAARELRATGHTWVQVGEQLGVAPTTAIYLAGRKPNTGASTRRAVMATLGCAGLRNSELCSLNHGDLDFAHGVIHVRDAKTETGVRSVNVTPWLREQLLEHRASLTEPRPDAPAFPTRNGTRRTKENINQRVITPSIALANERREAAGLPALPDAVTAHTFRRTYITLMLEAGAPIPYVQAQVGHADATTTLELYAQVLKRADRQKHGRAFDDLMTDAIPALQATETPAEPGSTETEIPGTADLSGHSNEHFPNL
jgi:integrase